MIYCEYREPNKITGDNIKENIYVHFDYDIEIVKVMRGLKRKFYFPETREWEITKEEVKELLSRYNDVVGVREEDKIFEDNKRSNFWKKAEIPENYKFKTEPFEYQKEYLRMALTRDKFLTGDTVGTGKSKESIDLACIRKSLGQSKKCLVINGIKGLNTNFEKQIEIHSFEKSKIIGSKITRKGTVKKANSIKERLEDLDTIKDSDIYFWITNIESFRDEKFSNKVKELCENGVIDSIIYDEATATKNPESQQSKGLMKIDCKYKNVMSGTFLKNHLDEMWFPLNWIGEEKRDFEEFKGEYCVEKIIKKSFPSRYGNGFYTKEFKKIVADKNETQLNERLIPLMIRRTQDEVQKDLPPILFEKQYVDMGEEQRKVYDKVKEELLKQLETLRAVSKLVNDIEKIDEKIQKADITEKEKWKKEKSKLEAELYKQEQISSKVINSSEDTLKKSVSTNINPQVMTLRLRQMTGMPQLIDKKIKENAKLDRCVEMVRENVANGDKTIIFTEMIEVAKELKKRLEEFNPAFMIGETPTAERQQQADKLQEDDTCKCIIGSKVMNMGWTLTKANRVIIIDEDWDGDGKEQQAGRVKRVGQTKKMLITTLLCADTIDEKVNEMVEAKSSLSNEVLDGGREVIKKSKKLSNADLVSFLIS